MVAFAFYILMHVIPRLDPEKMKTRTDLYSVRAGYTCFVAGIAILALWAIGVAIIGVTEQLRAPSC